MGLIGFLWFVVVLMYIGAGIGAAFYGRQKIPSPEAEELGEAVEGCALLLVISFWPVFVSAWLIQALLRKVEGA